MAAPAASLTLYGSWADSHTHRIQLALRLKGLAFDYVEADAHSDAADAAVVAELNPVFKKVPILVHDGHPISDSLVVLHYLDEAFPDRRPLLPPSPPAARAAARFWCHFADHKLAPSVAAVFGSAGGEDQRAAVGQVHENLRLLEKELAAGGVFAGCSFFGGDAIGILDIVLGCGSYWLAVFEEAMAGVKLVDGEEFPEFERWLRRFEADPEVKAAMPPLDKLLEYAAAVRKMMLSFSGAGAGDTPAAADEAPPAIAAVVPAAAPADISVGQE